MFDFILDPITEFIRDMLKGWIEDNLFGLFSGLNSNVAGVATEVSQTPSSWNGGVFNIIQNLSETVIVPVGTVIITYVLCYELISMLIDRNNMHEFDTSLFLKYIFKAGIAVFLLSKTSDIVMAVFDLGSSMSLKAGAEIYDSTAIPDVWADVITVHAKLDLMTTGELWSFVFETMFAKILVNIMSIEHVGIGTDFDGDGGVPGMANASEVINFTRRLLQERYTEEQIQMIWGGNFLRVMEQIRNN